LMGASVARRARVPDQRDMLVASKTVARMSHAPLIFAALFVDGFV
jgi:hypothetical protein